MKSALPTSLLQLLLLHHTLATSAIASTTTTHTLEKRVSTIIVTVSPTPTPISSSYTSDSTFQSDLLIAHNFFRGEHNVSDLAWNASLATIGAAWAKGCVFAHGGGATGENLAAGYANVTAAVDAWGLEREKYDFKKPTGFSEATGHFTQVVWSNTTSVGCGRMACNTDTTPGYYIVCEYWPHGNVEGDSNQFFKDNVKVQIKGKNTDTVESGVTKSSGEGWKEVRWGLGVFVVAILSAVVVM